MNEHLTSHSTEWVERFAVLLQEAMPYLRRALPHLSEDALIQLAARLVELRLGGVVDMGSEIR